MTGTHAKTRAARWWPYLVWGAVGLALLASVLHVRPLDTIWPLHWSAIVLLAGLIALGELGQVRMPTGQVIAPVSSAAAIALASLGAVEGQTPFDVGPAAVILIAAVGLVIGQVLLASCHRPITPMVAAARLLGVVVAAVLVRADLTQHSLWEWQQRHTSSMWAVALSMVAAGAVGILVELTITGLTRAVATRTHWRAALRDEVADAPALIVSLVAAGPVAALMAIRLGLLAFPMALLPMVATHIAVRRYVANRHMNRMTIRTLSRLTEHSGHTPRAHAERVAELSVHMGRQLGLLERDLRGLEYAALLHDVGQVSLAEPIPGGATVLAAPHDQQNIADAGASIVRTVTSMEPIARLVERQAVPYRAVQELQEEVPIAARIIKVANAFDDLTGGSADPARVTAALERLNLGLGYEYDPWIVDVLTRVLGTGR